MEIKWTQTSKLWLNKLKLPLNSCLWCFSYQSQKPHVLKLPPQEEEISCYGSATFVPPNVSRKLRPTDKNHKTTWKNNLKSAFCHMDYGLLCGSYPNSLSNTMHTWEISADQEQLLSTGTKQYWITVLRLVLAES